MKGFGIGGVVDPERHAFQSGDARLEGARSAGYKGFGDAQVNDVT
jgi:hypothetical protein